MSYEKVWAASLSGDGPRCESVPALLLDQRGLTEVKTEIQARLLGNIIDSSEVRTSSNVELIANPKSAFSDAFKLSGGEVRNDCFPLPDCGGANTQRPRDIRGSLKVINNVLLEHDPPFTTVKRTLQPQCKPNALTSVAMDKLPLIADRLNDAMAEIKISPSQLARACGVSPAAVFKWQTGGKLSADNLAAAARALGVREEWLRTGKLPREREHGSQEQDLDRIMGLLEGLQGPLAALATAIDQLTKARPEASKKRHRA
jgi:transcriptional regulator with XRE-family HTH domain